MSYHPYVAEQQPIMARTPAETPERLRLKRIAWFALVRMQMVHLRPPGRGIMAHAHLAQRDYETAMEQLSSTP